MLGRFGEPTSGFGRRQRRRAAASANGDLAEIVRALDSEGVHISHLQIHEPTLDDVFLAKTGRHLEGAGEVGVERRAEPAAT